MPEPEKGDKVSWNWGSGAPGGTVAEKEKEGEVSVKSKKGNIIKKNASPDNPAVAIERSGNNVVKKASELNIEKKANSGQKRKSGDQGEKEDDDLTKNAEGKEVRASGKKQKTEQTNGTAVNGEKKSTKAKPKKAASGAKKEKKPRATEGVGSRTRSRA